jgi:hypothetical protein
VLFRCCFDALPLCEWRHCGWQRRDVPSLLECSSVSVTHVHNYCTCGSLIGIYILNIPCTLVASSGSLCCNADTRFRLFLSSHKISHACLTLCQLIISLFYVISVNKLPAADLAVWENDDGEVWLRGWIKIAVLWPCAKNKLQSMYLHSPAEGTRGVSDKSRCRMQSVLFFLLVTEQKHCYWQNPRTTLWHYLR